jgi:hypothetical protein
MQILGMPASEPKQTTERPVLLDAIDITLRAIEERARLYRNLVVAVSAVSVLSILFAVFFRHWLALAGLIILVPLTGAYLVLDSRLLRLWRAGIVEMLRLRGLDVTAFSKTISGFRQVPPNSLNAMISTLPANPELTRRQVPRKEPGVVNDEFEALERKNAWRILLGTGFMTLALICLVSGAYFGSVALLLIGGSLAILVVALRRR